MAHGAEAYHALETFRQDVIALTEAPGLNQQTLQRLTTLKRDTERLVKDIPRNVLEVQAYLNATERMAPTRLDTLGRVEDEQGDNDAWTI